MQLILGDFHLTEQRNFDFHSSRDVCEFVFVLSGKFQNRLCGLREDVNIAPLSASLWMTPGLEGHHDCFPGADIRFVCVRIQRSLLAELAGEYLGRVPEDFRLVLENKQDRLYYRFSRMTIPMQSAARQIFQCPYPGAMGKIFLEGKALELISHLMAYHFGGTVEKKDPLRKREEKQIELARDILLEHMETPLSLAELARHAGISETKLTRGFRKVYGASVFGYLRNHRLDKARMLLETGDMNVTEVAYAVGFSSPSHFTRTFAGQYGSNPREYLRGFRHHS
ncbi:MAG: helix-turn-helix transcriptional regulator [Desulfobacteraceae bacterium]|nr:helix-turn-helix transcriptional regulator [Desulfobacteraceae bacterium]